MFFQLGVLCLLSLLCASSALPPCVCTRNLRPVCGSDGHTYNNECLLRCAQTTDQQLFMEKVGRCDGTNLVPPRNVRQADDGCICTLEYMPFCGTDGKTYPNRCSLNCAKRSAPVDVAYSGPCRYKRETVQVAQLPSRCSCPRNFAPVCGSDGKTYDNDCVLDCMSQKTPELTLKHVGLCDTETQPCSCSREAIPVCGTDGNTYDNACYLKCATENNNDLGMLHDGECDNSVKVVDSPGCACTREARPVCGNDGKTYGNPCMLNCAREDDDSLHIDYEGRCDDGVVVEPVMCDGCTRDKRLVCGNDGKTYWNPCMLNCAREKDDSLHIDYAGPCDNRVKVVESATCSCTREAKPVCGTDGNTYDNPCLLKCAREKDADLHVNHEGACDNRVHVVEVAENFPCTCNTNLKPVCSSNGVTFTNKCLMKCAGTHLTVAKEGPCEE